MCGLISPWMGHWSITHISLYLEGHGVVDVGQMKLFQEALVLTPKESDIRYAEQNHGESFQAQAKRPADFIPCTRCKEAKEDMITSDSSVIYYRVSFIFNAVSLKEITFHCEQQFVHSSRLTKSTLKSYIGI